jgi:hypothetical protein
MFGITMVLTVAGLQKTTFAGDAGIRKADFAF